MVLNVDENIVLLCLGEECLMVLEQLDCWLCNKNVDAALDGIEGNWVVGGVGGEDGDFVKC